MSQQFEGKKAKVTAAQRREIMRNAAHLLNKLRGYVDELGMELTAAEEEAFWKFIHILPVDDQSSVIN
jgi:hypothetical protein